MGTTESKRLLVPTLERGDSARDWLRGGGGGPITLPPSPWVTLLISAAGTLRQVKGKTAACMWSTGVAVLGIQNTHRAKPP